MSAIERRGRCRCAAVRFVARGVPRWVAHCHCESCRRATGAAFATYAGYPRSGVDWVGAAPRVFNSSPGVVRRFCDHCGSPMSYEASRWPDEIHLFVSSFEDPSKLTPGFHVYVEEQLAWLQLDDGLPRYRTTSEDEQLERGP
jgi:hypothetical protein